MPKAKRVESQSSLEKASRNPIEALQRTEIAIQLLVAISSLNFSLNSPKPYELAYVIIKDIKINAASDMIEAIMFMASMLLPAYRQQIAKEYEMLKQLKRMRVRKTYLRSLFVNFIKNLLGAYATFIRKQRTSPMKSYMKRSINMMLKLSRKEGQQLMDLTLLGRTQGDDPTKGVEKPLSYFIFMRGDRSILTESILPRLKQASCSTPKSQSPMIFPGTIVRNSVTQLAISSILEACRKDYF